MQSGTFREKSLEEFREELLKSSLEKSLEENSMESLYKLTEYTVTNSLMEPRITLEEFL